MKPHSYAVDHLENLNREPADNLCNQPSYMYIYIYMCSGDDYFLAEF